MEIMVYLGNSILDTRKYFGSQKILTEITAILWREWFCEINNVILLWKYLQWITFPIICWNKKKILSFFLLEVHFPKTHSGQLLFLVLRLPHFCRKFLRQIPGYQKAQNYFQVCISHPPYTSFLLFIYPCELTRTAVISVVSSML